MKKLTLILILTLVYQVNYAQDKAFEPKITLKWAPTGLIVGNASFQAEYSLLTKSSLTAKIGVPVGWPYDANFDGHEVDMHMRAVSFLAGFRRYLSKQVMRGFYIEPFFTYVHSTSDGTGQGELDGQPVTMDFTNAYNGVGIGVQLGAQFIFARRFVIDFFFLGPQLTSSTNNFRAIDPYNSGSWTSIQADEAEQDIKDFLNQFPFIRNKVDIHVDNANRTVTADFSGPLLGVRFGVSIGIAL